MNGTGTNTTVVHRNARIDVTLHVAIHGARPNASTFQRWYYTDGNGAERMFIGTFRAMRTTLDQIANGTVQNFTLTNWS